ncbi:MAG TPA: hypothetical protein PKA47_15020, partial [Accumulibacter sp.]|uniref:hypothetical protein n=1 Tax=Accumulibacter sp. TaxID=2053492 RepID=UPI002C0B55AF
YSSLAPFHCLWSNWQANTPTPLPCVATTAFNSPLRAFCNQRLEELHFACFDIRLQRSARVLGMLTVAVE